MEFEGRARITSRLDMTPLIDVVFLLLIFFLLTSTYMVPEAIDLRLPESRTAAPQPRAPTVVVLHASGQVDLDGEPVGLDDLAARLRRVLGAGSAGSVTLESDATVDVQSLLRVVDAVRDGGGRELMIATRRAPGAPPTADARDDVAR